MLLLILGLAIFAGVHLFAAFARGPRAGVEATIGAGPMKGLIAALLLASTFVIARGYRLADYVPVYDPPDWGRHLTMLLVLIGFVLFFAPYIPTNVKRVLRHPQLIGAVCWAAGHLLVRGHLAAILLFGGIAVWSVVMMLGINAREGGWQRPDPQPLAGDIGLVVLGVVVYAGVLWLHGVIGVPVVHVG